NSGSLAPRFAIKLMSLGKLSSNGPRWPFGYQIKWPMHKDAKFSPSVHEDSPETVPLHSFCQIFFPIARASLCVRESAGSVCGKAATYASATRKARKGAWLSWRCCFLDE